MAVDLGMCGPVQFVSISCIGGGGNNRFAPQPLGLVPPVADPGFS